MSDAGLAIKEIVRRTGRSRKLVQDICAAAVMTCSGLVPAH